MSYSVDEFLSKDEDYLLEHEHEIIIKLGGFRHLLSQIKELKLLKHEINQNNQNDENLNDHDLQALELSNELENQIIRRESTVNFPKSDDSYSITAIKSDDFLYINYFQII